MARRKNLVPSYLLHGASGQARVRIDGHDHMLGPYGSDESLKAYAVLIARPPGASPTDAILDTSSETSDDGPSVNEVCLAFWTNAKTHYVKNGKPTSEISCYKSCLKILRELYGMTRAKDFGPLALKAVRSKMVDAKWVRKNINRMVSRVRQVFKFAIENELIDDPAVLARLRTVAPLLADKTEAKDNAPRSALTQIAIDAVRQRVRPLVQDLIDLQLLTGARSGELLMLTTSMLDRSAKVWKVTLADHKTIHHGKERSLHFGPKARLILAKYISADPNKCLFGITRPAYCRAITRACARAEIDRWTPHWLRHTFCTRVRERRGIEAAQSMAGHSSSDATAAYATTMNNLAAKTAAAVG